MKEVNAGQRKKNHMDSESIKDSVTKIEINPTLEKEQSETKKVMSPPNPVSILVADDDKLYFDLIETILFPFDFNIFHANDGQEAVNIYRSNSDIKVILMDIQMPNMDGLTATEEIRKINPEVPIIAQSSFSFDRAKDKAIKSGCNEFLLKPVDPEALIMKIENYMDQKDQNRTS